MWPIVFPRLEWLTSRSESKCTSDAQQSTRSLWYMLGRRKGDSLSVKDDMQQ